MAVGQFELAQEVLDSLGQPGREPRQVAQQDGIAEGPVLPSPAKEPAGGMDPGNEQAGQQGSLPRRQQ
ncbi:hypothetical protein, partial [Streptomyces lavendulae]|uniref:hypothetical protein n=1 Tax=Streptomyces lavendulae TaxID=1914 RepID=UPI003484BD55